MFDEIVRIRQEKSKPILDNLYIFLQDCSIKFPESVGLAMAVLFLLDGFQELAGRKKRSTAVPICSRL
jgi:hypothetical protein